MFMFEIINKIIEEGGIFKCVEDPSIRIVDVDTSKDIKKQRILYEDNCRASFR